MALYHFEENPDLPHIVGTENEHYMRDPTVHDYRFQTALPFNAQGSRTLEECFSTFGHFYGTVPGDGEATAKYMRWLSDSFRNENIPELLDLIIDMPVGMKTSDRLSRRLRRFPLGLLSTLLKNRIRERGFNIALYHQFFFSGKINRIINDPVVNAVRDSDHPDVPELNRLKTSIERDISDHDSVFNFPLAKFELDLPLIAMDPTPYATGDAVDHFLVTPQGGNNQVTEFLMRIAYSDTGRLIAFNIRNYIEQVTRASGGSDRSFLLFGEMSYITKRFEVFHNRNNPVSVRRARAIRTAGIRQVLLEDHTEEFQHREGIMSLFTRVFVPGGIRNCFLACIRWAYVQSCRDEVSVNGLESMELAQDYDMLTTSDSIFDFDEDACYKRIDTILERALRRRAKQRDIEDVRDYMKRYKNGFPTVELNQICALLYFEFGIEVFYWRMDSEGRWFDVVDFPSDVIEPSPRKICLFQLNDQGYILNIQQAKKEVEEEVLTSGLEDGSLGHMTHAVSVFPPPKYFVESGDAISRRTERKRFKEALDLKTSSYFKKIY
jgi:hypothetical protein